MVHELKCWPEYFDSVFMGYKTFEVRKDDRGFQIGHFLILNEWNPNTKEYTGRSIGRQITYILQGGILGVEKGFVVMSIQ